MKLKDMPREVEEKKRARLRVLARKLKMPYVEVLLNYYLTDKQGREILRHEGYSHSFTRNYYNRLMFITIDNVGPIGVYGDGTLVVKDTAGTSKYMTPSINFYFSSNSESNTMGYGAPVNADGYGIQVGTDNTAEDFDDYVLGTPIDDGNAGGELEYAAMTVTEGWHTEFAYYWGKWERKFTNDGDGIVTVQEISQVQIRADNILIIRDVVSIPVNPGVELTVQYEYRVTFY